jgi:hypothetical protein
MQTPVVMHDLAAAAMLGQDNGRYINAIATDSGCWTIGQHRTKAVSTCIDISNCDI